MTLHAWLERCPLIAILRGVKPQEVESIVEVLAEEGLTIVEVPLNSPEPLKSIERLSARFGEKLLIGAGTVTKPSGVADVAAAGGRLIVTPHADLRVVSAAKERGLLAAPGFFNPTEAFALLDAGADALKLFPADVLGPPMLKAMRAVLPTETIVLPVGGVDAERIPQWIDAGARGFGLGTSLYRPGDTPGDVRAKARELVAAVAPLRQS